MRRNKKIIPNDAVLRYYFYFMQERMDIFWRKCEGKKILTQDPILSEYKFTNVYRACDRVSQYLISSVIYKDIDKFFEVISYQQEARQDSIFNYISPSEFYILADEGVSRGLSDERFWTDLIVPHVPQEVVNNQYIRDECKYLYNKYFREVR